MGLLDEDHIKNLFGTVLGGVYGDGRLIRVTKVRQPSGVVLPVFQQPVAIKIQIDRLTESMRTQAGYTQRAQKDYTDQDVRILILQKGVSGPMITSDDVVQGSDGRRWNVYEVGEDPARSFWRGRGVRVAASTGLEGWILEFSGWDDQGVWRDSAPWTPPPAPVLAAIEEWDSSDEVLAKIAGVLDAAGASPAESWADARDALNVALQANSLDAFADEATGLTVRNLINELAEAL